MSFKYFCGIMVLEMDKGMQKINPPGSKVFLHEEFDGIDICFFHILLKKSTNDITR